MHQETTFRFFRFMLLLMCAAGHYARAQQPAIEGRYYGSAHPSPEGNAQLFVFPDHTYAIPYFGGVQIGTWQWTGKEEVTFLPHFYPEPFAVWGRYAPQHPDSTRIFFQDVEEGDNYIGFAAPARSAPRLRKVFNEAANCIPFPVRERMPTPAGPDLWLSCLEGPYAEGARATYRFANSGRYNDFVIRYFKPDRNNRPFVAQATAEGLVFDRYKGSFGHKAPLEMDEETAGFMKELRLAIHKGLPDTLFFNAACRDFPAKDIDSLNYTFDPSKNAYVNRFFLEAKDRGEQPEEDESAYDNYMTVYPYRKLEIMDKVGDTPFLDPDPLFRYTCPEQE